MIIFEGLFKLVGACRRNQSARYLPEGIIDKAHAELAILDRMRKENAEMRRLLAAVVDAADYNLRSKRWPVKYAAPWRELARIQDWLTLNPHLLTSPLWKDGTPAPTAEDKGSSGS